MNVISFDLTFGLSDIAVIAQATNLPSQYQAQNQVNQIANHAQTAAHKLIASVHNILNTTINPYIAADSTNAIPKTVKVRKYQPNLSCLTIASNDLVESNHSQILTQNHANQIANHAQILAHKLNHSVPNILKETIKPYIAADSTNAIHNIVTVNRYQIAFSFFAIISSDFSATNHSQILIHNQVNQIANHIPINA